MRRALTIAGSDSGAGAGIQADLKTFAALGVYGLSAITSLTAQNTVGVQGIYDLPAEFVGLQIDAVAQDFGVDAVKTGMLPNSDIIRAVAAKVEEHRLPHLVVDAVIVAKDGTALMTAEARRALVKLLLPLAEVFTPNIPEAEELTGLRIESLEDMRRAAEVLHRLGPRFVVVKGGHLEGDSVDLLYNGQAFQELSAPRIATPNTHGTGCTFASALAASLAKGMEVPQAVEEAKRYVTCALKYGARLRLGRGRGPLHHFGEMYERAGINQGGDDG